ncbi:MAG TPA: GNAT family N-acetyltransferase [Candidatus Brocadiia bacterium]|nr:GNAT family N-acetyltransferase [Candidatus Brocadiia bacterium]
MDAEFRIAVESDMPAVVAVWREAFKRRHRDSQAKGDRAAREMRDGRCFILVAVSRGKIVGAVKNRLELLQVGSDTISKADVGEVAIRPSIQGCGIGSAMMTRNQELLIERGMHIARLGGMTRFYTRFGYSPVQKVRYRSPLGPVWGGVKKIEIKAATAHAERPYLTVRHFETESDVRQFLAIRETFLKDRAGNIADDLPPDSLQALKADRNRTLCADPAGRVLACMCATTADGLAHDLCYDANAASGAEALGMLWADFARRTARWGGRCLEAKLPDDPDLLRAMEMSGAPVERVETSSATVSTHVSILNLAGILERIAPTLSRRHAVGPFPEWNGGISLTLTDREMDASFNTAGDDKDRGDRIRIRLSQADFTRLLLGFRTISELPRCEIGPDTPKNRAIISALFPREKGFFF